MTRTTPWRRTILQLRQIFFTDANTFILSSSTTRRRAYHGAPAETALGPMPVL
jgi:hypothetical protein